MAKYITRTIDAVTVSAKLYFKEDDTIQVKPLTLMAPIKEAQLKKTLKSIYPDAVFISYEVVATESKKFQMEINKFLKEADEVKEETKETEEE